MFNYTKQQFAFSLTFLLWALTPPHSIAQTDQTNSQFSNLNSVNNPTILPEAAGTVNGGNPFQGLGRPDDTGPNRANSMQQYVPGNNSNGLFTSGTSNDTSIQGSQNTNVQAPAYNQQAGFAGQAGFPAVAPDINSAGVQDSANLLSPSASGAASTPQSLSPTEINSTNNESKSENKSSAEKHSLFSHNSSTRTANDTNNDHSHKNKSANSNGLTTAIEEIQKGNYAKSLHTLDDILKTEPKNAQVVYLKAVACVFMRNYEEAKQNYEKVLLYSTDSELMEKAKKGLAKLKH